MTGQLGRGRVIGGAVGVVVLGEVAHGAAPAIGTALEVAVFTGASVVALVVVGGVAYVVYRFRTARPRRAPYRVEVVTVVPDRPARRPARPLAALSAPRMVPDASPLAGQGAEVRPAGGARDVA